MEPISAPRRLAIHGGAPQRGSLLPYGRQEIDEEDRRAVEAVLGSSWLTTGPAVGAFEEAVCEFVGARFGVAVSSGTAGLHAVMAALGVGPGDEVIVPAMTFAATANSVLYVGARPVFADVDPDTLLLDPGSVEARLSPRTRAVVAVDYAGQACDYGALRAICGARGLALVTDGCHSLGARWDGVPIGQVADATVFSFHPVKAITTGEGGMVVTSQEGLAARLRRFRNHGIATDFRERARAGTWEYGMVELGYNYRLPDLACALGLSQLRKLPGWLERRRRIAAELDEALSGLGGLKPLACARPREHARHLYVVQLDLEVLSVGRREVFEALRAEGIGVNVHYLPVHLHPYYREQLGTGPGLCPAAEAAYERILSLPLFPAMSPRDVADVAEALAAVLGAYRG